MALKNTHWVSGTDVNVTVGNTDESQNGKLIILDTIIFSATAGGAAETISVEVADAAAQTIFVLQEALGADEGGTIFVEFANGLPVYRLVASGAVNQGRGQRSNAAFNFTATTINSWAIGYHYEPNRGDSGLGL